MPRTAGGGRGGVPALLDEIPAIGLLPGSVLHFLHEAGELAFDATLNLRRRPYSRLRLLGASLRTLTLIYAHALALKFKGAPYFPHPRPEAS